MTPKTNTEILACARRELVLRRSVYPRWVEGGRLSPEKAKHEIECMEIICQILEKYKMLQEISDEIREKSFQPHSQLLPQTPNPKEIVL